MNSFINKIIDWKDFEVFVANIYKYSDELVVEHDVTLVGKSNAKRQIDVIVTQTTKLHKYVTIIECKKWKEPVTRQVIDVLYASVEDLNANKGVIFTTKGYEEGAIEYAKSKNIDIFIVRDIRESEYGAPGRKFSLYLQMFSGKLSNFNFQNTKFYFPHGFKPINQPPPFAINFEKEQKFPENLQLYSINKLKGSNFVELLINIRLAILKRSYKVFNKIIEPEHEKHEIGLNTKVILNLSEYKFRYLEYEKGLIELDKIEFDFIQQVTQERIDFDRTAHVDFALVVENYISSQRNFISKSKENDQIILSEPIEDKVELDDSKIVKNKSLIQISTEHYVSFELNKEVSIKRTSDLILRLKEKI